MTFPCPHCGEPHEAGTLQCPSTEKDISPAYHMLGRVLDGKYELKKLLGEGDMGAVYLAEEVEGGAPAAVKVLKPRAMEDDEAVTRLLRDARAASEVHHENIVEVEDMGRDEDGTAYLVMQLLQGTSLQDLLKQQERLSTSRASDIMVQVLSALEAAHRHGIVHRDLKPANVFLKDHPGRKDYVKVLDFGIVQVKPEEGEEPTWTVDLVGNPRYMAPEQARGARKIDHRADIHACGVMLYQMLTGSLPFESEDMDSLVEEVVGKEPRSIQEHRPGISPDMAAIVHRAMQKDPDSRFETAALFSDALGQFVSPQVKAVADASLRMSTPMNWTSPEGWAMDVGSQHEKRRRLRIALLVGIPVGVAVLGGIAALILVGTLEANQVDQEEEVQDFIPATTVEEKPPVQQGDEETTDPETKVNTPADGRTAGAVGQAGQEEAGLPPSGEATQDALTEDDVTAREEPPATAGSEEVAGEPVPSVDPQKDAVPPDP